MGNSKSFPKDGQSENNSSGENNITTMHGGNNGIVTNSNGEKRALEREALRNVIAQWNANRLDLFELSEPNEDLEFHGVMRFYFQDNATGRAATKCVRVASDATAQDVVATLVEKFRPDMRMLTPAGSAVGQYALYEVHGQGGPGGGAARRLANDEKPLLVQLNWHIDDRDGRFLLRNIDDEHHAPSIGLSDSNSSFRRKLSKREKKQLKKQEKLARLKSDADAGEEGQENNVAEKLYTELPETSFTRSISNPEAVMRRRRQQKLEKRLQQFRSKDGGPDTGGTLKIYGEALCQDVPYKTLLLSVRDCAARVVREMLNKYGLDGTEDPTHWCLVQTMQPTNGNGGDSQEYVLDDDECPLAILMNHPSTSGSIMFHVRRRPADGGAPRKRKKKPGGGPVGVSGPGGQTATGSGVGSGLYHHRGSTSGPSDHHHHRSSDLEQCPMFIELGADHVTESSRTVRVTSDVMEVGSANGIALQLYGPHIQPRHCLIQYNADSGITTLTPCHIDAFTYVNGQRIHQTTVLQNGAIVKFGRVNSYRFVDPVQENRSRMYSSNHDNLSIYDRSPTRLSKDNNNISIDVPDIPISPTTGRERAMSPTNFSSPIENQPQLHSPSSMQQKLPPLSPTQSNNSHQHYPKSPHGDNSSIDNNGFGGNNIGQNLKDVVSAQNTGGSTPSGGGGGSGSSQVGGHKDNYETTFDLDGNVETVSTSSYKNEDTKSVGSENRFARGQDPILPAVLEFPETQQDQCLARVITLLDPSSQPSFKLAPAYTLYLCARYRASTHYRPELQPTERAHKLTLLLQHIASLIQNVIQERYNDSNSQAFWLANSSELLHFLKSDRHICAFSLTAQETLAESVQLAFSYLTGCTTTDLIPAINALLSDNNDLNSVNPIISNLSSTMSLLRHCRVNAALTIQLFSQLFHYISARSLNVILNTQSLCCKKWGLRLVNRLAHITRWAESQGLELAAECHLAKIQQCAHLLQAPKQTAEDIANLPSTCFKLNSVQLGALLGQYQCEDGEAPLSPAMVAQAVCVAKTLADELALADGREVRLLEQPTLPLALLLPEDGYSCDVVRGVPPGLADFLRQLQPPCRLASQPTSAGSWTVYMHQHSHPLRSPSAMSNRSGSQQPEIQIIKLHKSTSGMGLSIVAAKGAGQERLGIYIKSVVPGGAADTDGRLQAGDQLLRVDGQSLIGITQERAAEYLVRTGPIVTLEVAKQGAIYHGLATLLQQPSPPMSRGPRRMSERDIPSRFNDSHGHNTGGIVERTTIAASKSVPALHQVVDANDPPNIPQRVTSNTLTSGPVHNLIKNHHDVFNPGYSRTSSSNSINTNNITNNQSMINNNNNTQMAPPKSKSVHNLVSPQAVGQDQGFYQNLSVYRNKPNDALTLGDRASGLRSSQSSLHSNNPLSPTNMINNSQRPTSAYYSNSPMANHQMTSPATRPNQLLLPSSHHHQSIPNLKSSQSHSMLVSHQNVYSQQNHHDLNHPHMKQSQSQSALLSNNYNNNNNLDKTDQQYRQHSSMTALVRGQAKLAEMSEEVRRRQTRGMLSPQGGDGFRHNNLHGQQQMMNSPISSRSADYHHSHHQQSPHSVGGYNMQQQMVSPGGMGSVNYNHHPTQPQQSSVSQHMNHYYGDNNSPQHSVDANNQQGYYMKGSPMYPPVAPKPPSGMPMSSVNSKSEYEDDPPPVPPTTTHPLYTASLTEPPKGAFYPTNTNQRETKGTPATNPWEREEREKEQEARREAARQWRDRQIAELSAIPSRTPQQDEQLRALKLERDFQKRAEEAAAINDEEESTVSTSYSPQPVSSAMITSVTPVSIVSTRTQMNSTNPPTNSSTDNSNDSSQHTPLGPTSILKTSSGPNSPSKRDTNNSIQNTTNISNQQSNLSQLSSSMSTLTLSSDSNAPPPPERGSSYLAMSLRTGVGSSIGGLKSESSTIKRVSFNDNRSALSSQNNGGNGGPLSPSQMNNDLINNTSDISTPQLEMIREDPNQFISAAESMLASPTTPTDTLIAGATPGVIGAQEVYRDPRTRRLAEQQAKQASDRPCIPEKLSFKEKMKMFAMETGEQGTPKDRSKISRAQRDIDNIGGNTPPSSSQGMVH
ncbi:uncharacterized protein LOC123306030 isoform X1 [Chrysoperla carnea]|uniref:uncharacterized protein LOC123306030 isoform X1 n=1 Tax=Chrysoperla carnea TaxID=189513 RepID=UPI001D084854|nr:uncharacterized protein LOC123306030 isoform X1 [Chrysoperla carnea]